LVGNEDISIGFFTNSVFIDLGDSKNKEVYVYVEIISTKGNDLDYIKETKEKQLN
jgi:hypothetical protein